MSQARDMRPLALFATVAAAIFVGGTATWVVQQLFARTETPRIALEPTLEEAGDARLVRALEELVQAMREGRGVGAPPGAAGIESPGRVPVTESGETALLELTAVIGELRRLLQDQSIGGSAARWPSITIPPEGTRAGLPPLPPDVEDPDSAYTRQHLFWSEQQVLDRYGLPDHVYVGGSGVVTWEYSAPANGAGGEFHVKLYQGRVVSIDM